MKDYHEEVRNAIEVLRHARNNMYKEAFMDMIQDIIEEDINRYESVMLSGMVAKDVFYEKCAEIGIKIRAT